jgi:hypothetical protein
MDANEAPPRVPLAPALPPIGDFFRQVLTLGRQSIVPALPALVLLYCYRFGMGLYLVFSGDTTSPLGFPDYQARAFPLIVTATAYLPLLVLVYTPFLPLQDAILRGTKRSFMDSTKHVLERLWPYGVSSLIQFAIIVVPATMIVLVTGLATLPFGALPDKTRAALILLAMAPAAVWIVVSLFLMIFATPLLLLDGRGPLASIRESFRLMRRHFSGLLGRFVAFIVVIVIAAVFFSLPSAMLTIVTAVARQKIIGVEIARAVWDSAVSTATFPFSVAGLLILYRALVPARESTAGHLEPAAAGDVPVPTPGEATGPTPPYRFE